MLKKNYDSVFLAQLRFIFCIVLLEYLLFIFSGVSFSFLQGDTFFSFGVDPASWFIFLTGLPQYIITHHWLAVLIDTLTIFFLLLFVRDPLNNKIALILLILLFFFYISLMAYLTHRNFQTGIFLVFVPFIFGKSRNRLFSFEAVRYYMLLFYISAAVLKISSKAWLHSEHFSHMISQQFATYFVEGNTGTRTSVNIFMAGHPGFTYVLYIASIVIEGIALIGFFTKRFDSWLAIAFLGFHFLNWVIMDIAPLGQIGFICLLFISRRFIHEMSESPENGRIK